MSGGQAVSPVILNRRQGRFVPPSTVGLQHNSKWAVGEVDDSTSAVVPRRPELLLETGYSRGAQRGQDPGLQFGPAHRFDGEQLDQNSVEAINTRKASPPKGLETCVQLDGRRSSGPDLELDEVSKAPSRELSGQIDDGPGRRRAGQPRSKLDDIGLVHQAGFVNDDAGDAAARTVRSGHVNRPAGGDTDCGSIEPQFVSARGA